MNSKKLAADVSEVQGIHGSAWVKPQALAQVVGSVHRGFYSRFEKLLQGRLIDRGKERGQNLERSRVDIDFAIVGGKDGDHLIKASTEGWREALDQTKLTKSEQGAITGSVRWRKTEVVGLLGSAGLGKVIAIKPVQQRIEEAGVKVAQGKQALGDLTPPAVDRAAGIAQGVEVEFALFIAHPHKDNPFTGRQRRQGAGPVISQGIDTRVLRILLQREHGQVDARARQASGLQGFKSVVGQMVIDL